MLPENVSNMTKFIVQPYNCVGLLVKLSSVLSLYSLNMYIWNYFQVFVIFSRRGKCDIIHW